MVSASSWRGAGNAADDQTTCYAINAVNALSNHVFTGYYYFGGKP